jgi:S-adenosylmethionine:tRNA ribosyltransferase-isomerase
MITKKDYFYELPPRLIAQHPPARRDESRLLVLDGQSGAIEHRIFSDLPDLVRPGDCLVLNNTRVLPARLLGARSDSRTAVECLLLHRRGDQEWEVIVRPGRRVRPGHWIEFLPGELSAEVLEVLPDGNRVVRFHYAGLWENILERAGTMPLPPYIHEQLADRERYQTVYARHQGSAAAPTAGLHFTPELLAALQAQGVTLAELTLHVGLGTFRPVKTDNILDHTMHSEFYDLPASTVAAIAAAKARGSRVIAVGTTSCRVLEAVASQHGGRLEAQSGWTDIFIYPGYRFKVIDALITNFHLPESTLLMLVSALAGRETILRAYQTAIDQAYRFFSFGDAMMISRHDPEQPRKEPDHV